MRSLKLLFAFLLLLPAAAFAQTGIYAGFSASDFNIPNVGWNGGTTFGVYHDMWHVPFFSVGADARASLLGGSGQNTIYSGTIGPQLRFRPHVVPFMPYVAAEVGGAKIEVGQGSATTDKTSLNYNLIAGLDWTIFPRIDWRVAEFSYMGFTADNIGNPNPKTLTTGIVVRLP
jgi:hypothetical protein